MLNFLNALTLNMKNKLCVWSLAEDLCNVLYVSILLNATSHGP